MVGKWYKFIDKSGDYLTKGKWYKCMKMTKHLILFLDNENKIENLNNIPLSKFNKWFDTSNPMDYNPDEIQEEVKPQHNLKVETITIVVINDDKYQTNTTLSPKELVKHLKEATYRLDKQINE